MGKPGTLRVNVLEQCQYDCNYCRPGSINAPLARANRLSVPEYARLARLFARLELHKVRFTGGEPLLRPELPAIINVFREAMPAARLAVTTNGQKLGQQLEALREVGVSAVTVHVDSLRADRYRRLMGDGDVCQVLGTLEVARTRFERVKLNMVVQRGENDDELCEFLAWSATAGIEVRFIELMNTGSAVDYTRRCFVSGQQIISAIAARVGATALPRRSPGDPAKLYRTDAGVTFGLIASDTQAFCEACDRLRLSPDGRLRGCLYEAGGAPLGAAVREGASDESLWRLLQVAVGAKRSHHPAVLVERQAFSMADVGG